MRRTRGPSSLDGHRRLGAAVAAVVVALAVIAVMSTNGPPLVPTYELTATLPADAPTLRAGSEVRIAGRHAGLVKAVEPLTAGRQRVRFTVRDHPVGRDARLTVRLRAPAGRHYLDLDRGDPRRPLADGGAIAAGRVGVTEDLPTVVRDFDARALAQMRRAIGLVGGGVLGRGDDLGRGLEGLDTTLRDTAALARAATRGRALGALVRDAATTARALRGQHTGDLARLTTASASFFATLGAPSSHLAGTLRALPPAERSALRVLPQVDPLLNRAATLASRLRPGVVALREALPAVDRLLLSAPVLRSQSARLAGAARPALAALAPVLRRVGGSAWLLARGAPSLQTFAAYLARFPRELESGLASYYVPYLYRPNVGRAPGSTVATSMLILTCATGHNPDPQPGSVFTDKLERPCR
jgi:ABC-type transporter Mla subunit MlaD